MTDLRRKTVAEAPSLLPSLSPKETVVLELLKSGRELYGLELVERSGGEIGRGTVYVTLNRMSEKGLVESTQAPLPAGATGLPRRLYRITAEGARLLRAREAGARAYGKAVLA